MLFLAAGAQATPSEGIHNIQHVVMIMQENRSFDSYFGTYPGANGIPPGTCVPDTLHGGCVKPFYDANEKNNGGPHGLGPAIGDVNGGLMNGYVQEAEKGCTPTELRCFPCKTTEGYGCIDVMGYHDARQIPNYWTYAHNYVLQDNMFESAASWSKPEHLYTVSGWSAVCPEGDSNPLDCAGNLGGHGTANAWTDITYLMYKAQVSWRYYVFEGSEPDCESDEALSCEAVRQGPLTLGIWNPLRDFTDVKQDGQLGNIQSLTNFYKATNEKPSCGLPNVSWIDPNFEVSEHPNAGRPAPPLSVGQAYVTTLVNTIMRSPCWNNTAIFISWDDWGGFYDHVTPPTIDENGYGLRVPGLVISPYAKTGYIDHQQLSHDAYLKFIEDDFLNRQRLNPATDGRPDKRPDVREEAAGLGDLANDFEFNQAPRPPMLLPSHPPPGPPSQPPGGEANAPSATDEPVTARMPTSATLNALVNPNGGAITSCEFDYGTSTFMESSSICVPNPGSGHESVAVHATIEGLTPGTTYYYRILVTNAGGTSSTRSQSFKTPVTPPSITGVSPNRGSKAGGTPVKVTGTGFVPGTGTTFTVGMAPTTSASCPTSTECTFVTTAHPEGLVNVRAAVHETLSPQAYEDRFHYE